MARHRVAVTGIGAVTPIGEGAVGLWRGLRHGRSAVDVVTRFNPREFRSHLAAEVRDFDPTRYADARRLRRLDRFSQFALACAYQAVGDAGLELSGEVAETMSIFVGSALGGVAFGEEQHARYLAGGPRAVDPALALTVFTGAAGCNIAMALGVQGPVMSNGNSCAAGAVAVGEAFRAVRAGLAPVALAGGIEAPLAPLTFGSFAAIRAMSTRNHDPARACRPFDRDRDGFVMGEGGALLVLEDLEHARARAAPIYAELLGYGSTNDAHHMTAPLPTGAQAARAMRLALADARLDATDIDYVNAHGSSTPLNDSTETLALKQVFGNHAYRVPISSTKAFYGHPLGASGAVEAAICCLALQRGFVPPTLNLEVPDPACDLDYVPAVGRAQPLGAALSNSFGFGGINASLVLGRWEA